MYPDQHCETDNRQSWFLGVLGEKYGNSPVYVHLKRDRAATVTSLKSRWASNVSIMKTFGYGVLMDGKPKSEEDWHEIAEMYFDTVTQNIELFLRQKTKVLEIRLENPLDDFAALWRVAQVEGNIQQALAEWSTRHNCSKVDNLPAPS